MADAAPATTPAKPDRRKLRKLIVPLTADNKPALDRMTPSTRARLSLVMGDAQLQPDAGGAVVDTTKFLAGAASPAPSTFPVEYTDPILKILCSLAAIAGAQVGEKTGWWTPDDVVGLVVFNTAERKELGPAVASCIEYNFPGLLSKSNPNIALALAVGAVVQKKLEARAAAAPKDPAPATVN